MPGTEAATPTHSSLITDPDPSAGGVSDQSGGGVTLASRAGEQREKQRHKHFHSLVGY